MNDAITPFTLAVPQADLEDLNRRIDQTRWPDAETVDDWTQGAPLAKVKALVDHWRHRYDWRRCEAMLNDWGDDCAAIHVNMPLAFPEPDQLQDIDPFEQAAQASLANWEKTGSAYFKQQSTRPQTLGYGLADSPVGQAAWIYEKMWAWTDNQGNPEDALTLDEMLDNIMLYWLPSVSRSGYHDRNWKSGPRASSATPARLIT
jgi:hypothetical protein